MVIQLNFESLTELFFYSDVESCFLLLYTFLKKTLYLKHSVYYGEHTNTNGTIEKGHKIHTV